MPISEIIYQVLQKDAFWTIAAVIAGFSLGEASSLARHYFRIRRLKKVIREELRSIHFQIDQKKDIIHQALSHISNGKVLPMKSVRILAAGYENHITELYPYLTSRERDSLHVIYGYLQYNDDYMNEFDSALMNAWTQKVMEDPLGVYASQLKDINASYDLVKRLIQSYLDGKPEDVFYVEDGGFLGNRHRTNRSARS